MTPGHDRRDDGSFTYTETVSNLRGDMREGFARIEGEIHGLRQSIEAGNRAHAADANELRKDVDDHEFRLRRHDDRLSTLDSRPHITPKGMWGVSISVAGLIIGAIAVIF